MKRSALPFVRGVRVWLRENVADAALAAQRLEGAGAVAASVVGEEPLAVDAMIREAAQSAFEECCGVDCVLGRRSEERRVGKECRARVWRYRYRQKSMT